MSQLSEDNMEEIRKNFQYFDKNEDGTITCDELCTVMRSLGQNPTNAEVKAYIDAVDSSGNGKIEFQEFVKLMSERGMNSKDKEAEELTRAFNTLDRDGNGFITAQELRHVMTCLGERMTEEEADAMIKEADCNHDGRINYTEFIASITSSQKHI